MAMRVVHNRLSNVGTWFIGRNFRLPVMLSSLIGLMTVLAPVLVQAQEEAADAAQASGDVAVSDAATSPEPGIAAPNTALPARASVVTGQGAIVLLQQWPQAAVWLEADDGDGASRSVLALLFTPLTKTATTAVVVLADEGNNPGEALVTALARGLADRGLTALTLGLRAPPGLLGRLMERELPLPAAAPSVAANSTGKTPQDNGTGAISDPMLIDVMPGAEVSDAEVQYRLAVTADVQAAVRYLKREEYQNVVIVGIGRGASFATALPELADSDGLIWLLPRFYPRDHQELAQRFSAASHLRVLDVEAARGDRLQSARQRAVTMSQVDVANYQRQRVAVHEPVQARHGDALSSRLAAWVQAGTEAAEE